MKPYVKLRTAMMIAEKKQADRKAVEAKITGSPISVKPQVQIYLSATDIIEAGEDDGKKQ